MAAMTGEEFATKATSGEGYKAYDNAMEWMLEAGAVLGVLSLHPEHDKDRIVEAIQTLALRMPTELVGGSVHKLFDVKVEYRI